MNKPAPVDYALGNWIIVPLLACGTWLTAMRCLTQSGSWLLPITCVLLIRVAVKARQRVKAFEAWQGTWKAMAAPTTEKPAKAPGRRIPRVLPGALLWFALRCWLHAHAAEPLDVLYCAGLTLYVALMAWGAVATLLKVARWLRTRSATHASRSGHVVSVCLGVPWGSPSPQEFTAALPDYCRALLARNAAPAQTAPPALDQSA